MSTYCLLERPYELFTESLARGWLAAIRDWPNCKGLPACTSVAQGIPDELRPEVCCIGGQNYSYHQLVIYAWVNGYMGFQRCSERQIVGWVTWFAAAPNDEGLRHLHQIFSEDEGISETWARFPDFQARALLS